MEDPGCAFSSSTALESPAEIVEILTSEEREERRKGARTCGPCNIKSDIVNVLGGASATATYHVNRLGVIFRLVLKLLVTQNFSFLDFFFYVIS